MAPPTQIHVGSVGGGAGGDGGQATGRGSGGHGGRGEAPRLSIRQFLNNTINITNIGDSLHAVDEALNGISIAGRGEGLRDGPRNTDTTTMATRAPASLRHTTAPPLVAPTLGRSTLFDHRTQTIDLVSTTQTAIDFVITIVINFVVVLVALLVGRNPAHDVETLPAAAASPVPLPTPATSDSSAHTPLSQAAESPADDEFGEEAIDETTAAQRRAAKGKARARTDHSELPTPNVASEEVDVAAAIAVSRLPDRTTQGASTSRRPEGSSESLRPDPIESDTSSARVTHASAAAAVRAAAAGTTAGAAAPPAPAVVPDSPPDGAAPLAPAGPPPVQTILVIFL
ncbi:hypothetical protein B0H11DRAFT_2289357 [Mycena galericulata]|nr:hypothetical protein B0H11DRAFT_2289357 [Mycena galericulata]